MIEDILVTLDRVKRTRSRIEKGVYLRTCKDPDLLKAIICATYDWHITYGITLDGWNPGTGRDTPDESDTKLVWEFLKEFLPRLSSRRLTGMEARTLLANQMAGFARPVQFLLRGVINRSLDVGASVKTFNESFPDLLAPFAVMLCNQFDPEHDSIIEPWFVEPKYDGVRAIVGKNDGIIWTAVSRNGNELFNCEPIIEELSQRPEAEQFIFDGEVRSANFHETVGSVHSPIKGVSPLKFYVFDALERSKFPDRDPLDTYHRRKRLIELLKPNLKHVELVSRRVADSTDDIERYLREFIDAGYEGVVLKRASSRYQGKRSKDWLKLKERLTMDCTILSCIEGTGKHSGKLGSFTVEQQNGELCSVGSGLDDKERQLIWDTRDSYKGRAIEVAYQELSPIGVMRFPTFLRFREDKDE